GDKYVQYWPVLTLICFAQLAQLVSDNLGMMVFAFQKPVNTLLVDGVAGSINLLMAPLLIHALAEKGVALGQTVGFVASALLCSRLLKSNPEIRIGWSALRKLAVPCIVAG